MRDLFLEILATLRTNKLRTALTGFAVSWGILIIIVLLGAGNGLINAFMSNSEGQTTNSMTIYDGWASKAYGGYSEGRAVEFSDKDIPFTEDFSDKIDNVYPLFTYTDTISSGHERISADITGNHPEQQGIGFTEKKIVGGRFINDKDIEGCRKVVVMDDKLARKLMQGGADDSNSFSFSVNTIRKDADKMLQANAMIGRHVNIGHITFLVVGIYEAPDGNWGHEVFIPSSTFRRMRPSQDINYLDIMFHGLETKQANSQFEDDYRQAFNSSHGFDPTDKTTLFINNNFVNNIEMTKAQRILRTAMWILGLFTLLSGIIGVSNIMLITVRERTHEFGIRKAIGATPLSLLRLIVTESISITTFFGMIGIFLGMAMDRLMDKTLASSPMDVGITQIYMFKDIGIGMDVAFEVLALLIVAGTVAGMLPAWKAAMVRPIEALNKD